MADSPDNSPEVTEPTPSQEGASQGTSAPPTGKRKRRWLRRILWFLAVVLLLIVLLVALLPTILTSGPAEDFASEQASEILGREVKLEGLSFGWTKPLRLDRLRVGAEEGEGDYPLLDIENVSMPKSLLSLAHLPPYEAELNVGRIEANVVRDEDGVLNLEKVLQAIEERFPPKDVPEPEPEPGPIELPLDQIDVGIETIDLRYVDLAATRTLIAGLEDGALSARWPGGPQPLALTIEGAFRLNDERLPWDVQAEVRDWIDAERVVTTETLTLAATSAESLDNPDLTGGGFSLLATLREMETNSLRVRVPFTPLYDFARGYPLGTLLPPDLELPETVAGTLELGLKATHSQQFQHFTAETEASLRGFAVEGGPVAGRLALPGLEHSAFAEVDLASHTLERLDLSLESAPLTLTAEAAALDWLHPAEGSRLMAQGSFDLGRLASIGAEVLGAGDQASLLDARFGFSARLLEESGPNLVAVGLTAEAELGELRTLEPFAENPEFLTSGSLNLRPLSFVARGPVRYRASEHLVTVPDLEFAGAFTTASLRAEVNLDDPLATWELALFGGTHLTDLIAWDALDRFKPADLPDVRALADYAISGYAVTATEVATSGTVNLTNVTVDLPLRGKVLDNATIAADWDVRADYEDLTVDIARVGLESPILRANLRGRYTPRDFNLEGGAGADLEPIMDIASLFAEIPAQVGGSLAAEFSGSGNPGDAVEMTLRATTPRPLAVEMPGLIAFSEPFSTSLAGQALWEGDGISTATLDLNSFTFGDALAANGKAVVDLTGGRGLDFELDSLLNTSPTLALLDPALLESYGAAVAAEGTIETFVAVDGPFAFGEDGVVFSEAWTIAGENDIALEFVDWLYQPEPAPDETGELAEPEPLAGVLGGVFDNRKFNVSVDLTSPVETLVYEDGAISGFDFVEGPMGVAVDTTRVETAVRYATGEPIPFSVMRGSYLGGVRYGNEIVTLEWPRTDFATATVTDLEATEFLLDWLEFRSGNVFSGDVSALVDWATLAWRAEGGLQLESADALDQTYTLSDEALAALVPEMQGGAALLFDLKGYPPPVDYQVLDGWPVTGRLRASLEGFQARSRGAEPGEALYDLQGVRGAYSLDLPTTGSLAMAAEFLIDRVDSNAIPEKPLEDLEFRGHLAVDELDEVSGELELFEIASYRTQASGTLRIEGLRDALAANEWAALPVWLQNVTLRLNANLAQDLTGLDGFVEDLDSSGALDLNLTVSNTPRNRFRFAPLLKADNVNFAYGQLFRLDNFRGEWNLEKTLLLDPGARPAPPAPPGILKIEDIFIDANGLGGHLSGTTLELRGVERGLTISTTTVNFLGGPATSQWKLFLDRGLPILSGSMEITGLNGGNIVPGFNVRDVRQAEINAVASLRWIFPENPAQTLMDNLALSVRTTRIGSQALRQILRALDSNQDDPRFQAAIAALNLGSPSDVELRLENALVTARGDLRLATGNAVPLPILDREPVGGLVGVYDFSAQAQLLEMVRRAIIVILSDDLSVLQEAIRPLDGDTEGGATDDEDD